jgi:hypothetical protein
MISVDTLKTALSYINNNPSKAFSGIYHQIGTEINRHIHQTLWDPSGIKVMDQDWDNLLILDGCRLDLYQEVRGDVESRRSFGSTSWGFLERNFQDEKFHDTIYISANPFAPKLKSDTFYMYDSLLESDQDPDIQTTHPKKMTDAAIANWENNRNKRLIVHYMQPHCPFIGQRGRKIHQAGIDNGDNSSHKNKTIWTQLQYGLNDMDKEAVWEPYRENLKMVLDEAIRLHNAIDGKTVITSDHGNLIGDQIGPLPVRGYGHPTGLYVSELLQVPWETLPGERRKITKERPQETDSVDDNIIKNRLKQLGYRT